MIACDVEGILLVRSGWFPDPSCFGGLCMRLLVHFVVFSFGGNRIRFRTSFVRVSELYIYIYIYLYINAHACEDVSRESFEHGVRNI